MNLQHLFELQAGLDLHIEKEHPAEDKQRRLLEKVTALQVELSECQNEHRGFKFWSKDQEPRTSISIHCPCHEYEEKNPLLEEYVDCLHFFLSIGNELKVRTNGEYYIPIEKYDVLEQFSIIRWFVTHLEADVKNNNFSGYNWLQAFIHFLKLAELLGFTWEQVEQAYLDKNKINHERQMNNY